MAVETFHARHRSMLERLSSDEFIRELIDRHADHFGIEAGRPWRREWDRIPFPHPAELEDPCLQALVLVTIVGESRTLCTLEIGFGGRRDRDVGSVLLRRFPDDSSLCTLGELIEEDRGLRVVRYRPNKRCTMQTDRDGGVFVKVFADDRGWRLHHDGTVLWNAAKDGVLDFAVSEPLRYDGSKLSYSQRTVPGEGLTARLFEDDGHVLAYRIGAASASIPSSGLKPSENHGPDKELARSRRRARELQELVPSLQPQLDRLVQQLDALHARFDERRLLPIHGSPHPNQWLLHESGLGLVDFDRLALGDPELDVATFTTEVEFESADTRWDVMEEFERGYRDRYGDLDSKRLLAYESHKRLAKVYRTARAIRPFGDERANELLNGALETLMDSADR